MTEGCIQLIDADNNEDKYIATESTLEALTELTNLQRTIINKVTACDPVSVKSLKFNRKVHSPFRLYL